MASEMRKIILVDQIQKSTSGFCKDLKINIDKVVFLDPIKLLATLNWLCYDEDVTVLNSIYGKLFDDFVLEDKVLVCYWPKSNFPDDKWFELSNFCKEARIFLQTEFSLLDEGCQEEDNMPLQESWKSLLLLLLESLSEDINLNEGFEELANLYSEERRILIFSIMIQGKREFSCVEDIDNCFEFSHSTDQNKLQENVALLFQDFTDLVAHLQSKFKLQEFKAVFNNLTLEKEYFHQVLKSKPSINFIQSWLETYQEN